MKTSTCSFFGHRTINVTAELKENLNRIIENLIIENNVDTFLFGSKSQFDTLCYEQVTELKEKHPHIKRIYVRAEFAQISEKYKNYLLEDYEDTYHSPKAIGAGKAVYVERNFDMINKSNFCIIYYQSNYSPKNRKSGTGLALSYAIKRNKKIILLP